MSIIYSVIGNLRKYIAHYLKEVYMTPLVESNLGEYVAVDESLFCHNHGNEQIWLIGLVNTRNKNFRIEAVKSRDSDILEKIIRHHVGIGNNIVTDGWGAYNWMNSLNSGYHRIIHIHGHHDFGYGAESTSHVESVWGELKQKFRSFYVAVKSDNFILFAKEMEFRKKVAQKNKDEIIKKLQFIFNHIAITVKYDLFKKEDLEDYEKEAYQLDNDSSSNDGEDEEDIDL